MPTWDATNNRVTTPYFSLTLEPLHGGRIVSLSTSSGELTTGAAPEDLARARVPYKFGLLAVQLWQDSYWHNDLNHLPWTLAAPTVTPTRVEVAVQGQSLLWEGVHVERRFVFTDDPWIDVFHQLNPGPAGPPITTSPPYAHPAFWFTNVMRGRGRTFVPGPAGVLDYPRWPQDQSWCHEPTDGWIAWLDAKGGLAFVTEPAHLRHVRVCHLGTDRVDWVRRRTDTGMRSTIENTTVRLVPFHWLRHVDGVGPAGLVSVDPVPGGVTVGVYPLLTGDASVSLERIAPDGRATPAGSGTASLTAGHPIHIPITEAPGPAGVWWRGTLQMAGSQGAATMFLVRAADLPGYLRASGPAVPLATQVTELGRKSAPLRPPRSFNFNAAPVPFAGRWVR